MNNPPSGWLVLICRSVAGFEVPNDTLIFVLADEVTSLTFAQEREDRKIVDRKMEKELLGTLF